MSNILIWNNDYVIAQTMEVYNEKGELLTITQFDASASLAEIYDNFIKFIHDYDIVKVITNSKQVYELRQSPNNYGLEKIEWELR